MTTDGPRGSHTLLYVLIAAMVLLWSANYIIGKIALREFPPLLAAGLRIALAGLFMVPLYLVCVLAVGPFTGAISPARELFRQAQAER